VDEVEYFGRGKGIPQASAGIQIQTICAIGLKFGKKSSWLASFLHYQPDQLGFGCVPIATIQKNTGSIPTYIHASSGIGTHDSSV